MQTYATRYVPADIFKVILFQVKVACFHLGAIGQLLIWVLGGGSAPDQFVRFTSQYRRLPVDPDRR